jgi:hypothetical protein
VRELPAILDPTEARRRAAIFGWINGRLAELLDEWSSKAGSDAAKTVFAKHAANFGWHAKLWDNDILGGKGKADPGDTAKVVDAVAASDVGDLIAALTAVYRVLLPRVIAAQTYHQHALNVHEDAATHRWVPFILQDQLEAVRDGELLLQGLLTDAKGVETSASTRATLESMIVEIGGLLGPSTLGDFSEDAIKEVPVR